MTQYIIILLDDTSVSFCHYGNGKKERNLMSLETLKAAIIYAMKENLNIQFVYPSYELPSGYPYAPHTKHPACSYNLLLASNLQTQPPLPQRPCLRA